MAHKTPQFNIKTGADSSLFFSREFTGQDVAADIAAGIPAEEAEEKLGLIKKEADEDLDIYKYPVLTRRTGHSIKGSTESIESNELRKGRTKSAPRKGNSSSEGSLEFELSPETYDDIFEAALRGKWTNWTSDTDSASNIVAAGEVKPVYPDGCFATAFGDPLAKNGTEHPYAKLIGTEQEVLDKEAVLATSEEVEIAELCCGTEDIKYSALAQYGGITGEDLYQEFEHLAVNTMSLSVSPGQIVTGSFGFMGANNPDLLQTGDAFQEADPQPADLATLKKGKYFEKNGDGDYVVADPDTFATTKTYYVLPAGIIKQLAKYPGNEGRFLESKTPEEVKKWIENLPEKGTSTDQFTAREGFLYIAGERVQYGSNLTFDLNNGLKQIFAIFEKGAISTAPMSLDITGTLDAYLIKGHSEVLYNLATQDKDVEVLFCFQDKEDDPEALYVMQIFKTKFTDTDISQGAEELTVSLPFQSFEERACRIFRIRKRKPIMVTYSESGNISVELSTKPADTPTTDNFTVTVKVDGVDKTTDVDVTGFAWNADEKSASWTSTAIEKTDKEQRVDVTVEYNGVKYTSTSTIAAE